MANKNYLVFCKCGCGEQRLKYDKKGRTKEYLRGHFRKGKIFKEQLSYTPVVFCACGCGRLLNKHNYENCRMRTDRPLKWMPGHSQIGRKNSYLSKLNKEDNPSKRPEVRAKKRELSLGITNIERFGEERSKIISNKLRKDKLGKGTILKGKKYEEIMGVEKAKEIKKLRSEHMKQLERRDWTKKERKTRSKLMLEKWKSLEYREKTLKNMLKNRYVKPTSFENKIASLCIKHKLPFTYTGNGTFFVGTKNPDFKHNTKPIVIEVFYNYFKKKIFGSIENYIKNRQLYFSQYGFEIIFICQQEIQDRNWEEWCLIKIKNGIDRR